jgi:hypothetical protein
MPSEFTARPSKLPLKRDKFCHFHSVCVTGGSAPKLVLAFFSIRACCDCVYVYGGEGESSDLRSILEIFFDTNGEFPVFGGCNLSKIL